MDEDAEMLDGRVLPSIEVDQHQEEASPPPPVDEQIERVMQLSSSSQLSEGDKGFVVAQKWLSRVLARGSKASDKESTEEPVGPVDNTAISVTNDLELKDESGSPFVPLRPGLVIGEDFEIVSQSAWDLIISWYGLSKQSPVITRFYHNTSPTDAMSNMQWEVYPPIFVILKLPDMSDGVTKKSLEDKRRGPVSILASRHQKYNVFLKRAKEATHIDMAVKVRTWRLLKGVTDTRAGILTPAQSRSSSPAPGVVMPVDPGSKLAIDANTFLSLQFGSEREVLEFPDETNNSKYNGHTNLDFVGLRQDSVLVLEEQSAGEWVSDGIKAKKPSLNASRQPSPGPMMTRGRQNKHGRSCGAIGLNNLGNTCYMNSALQCVRSVEELTQYFLHNKYKQELNRSNPLGHNGQVAAAYANLLREMYSGNVASLAPRAFKNTIGKYAPSFSGYQQQDSQEFLLFLLDGLQEDLNRIHQKPYIEKPDSTDEMVNDPVALKEMADKCWDIYKKRNDSVITDLFAGMYKSTVVCPVCDKVSIIFDPFNNLTLQLPIENMWNRPILYFPLGRKPVIVNVDIDKNASFRTLKEHVAGKFPHTDPKRLVLAETYKHKFYKMFEDEKSINEENIVENDVITLIEVERRPTSWPQPRSKMYNSDDNTADEILVSVFNRRPVIGHTRLSATKELFGVPGFIVLNRQEARNPDIILQKVLALVATMTSRDFLAEEDEGSDDSNTVLIEDAESRHAESLESEDGLVDVSNTPKTLRPGLRELFDISVVPKEKDEFVSSGWSSLDEEKTKFYPKLGARYQKTGAMETINAHFQRPDPQSSDEDMPLVSTEDSDSEGLPPVEQVLKRPSTKGGDRLVNLGEGLLLDWTEDSFDALFGGSEDQVDEEMRGVPTWDPMETHADPFLEERRLSRANRRKHGISLDDCLDEFGRPEILSENDAWYCPRCKEHRRASKKFELWKSPDILVIHLKRFSAHGRFRDKLDVRVDFPVQGLDLNSRVVIHDKTQVYDLFAVDNHYGGLGGGHYTAFAQNFVDGKWYEYNDSSVSSRPDPEATVITPAAYLLFYRRRESVPLGGPFFEHTSPSNSQDNSRAPSPAGDGRRLGGTSSHNGPSSATAGAGHQGGGAGGGLGGSEDETLTMTGTLAADEGLPPPAYQAPIEEDEGLADMEAPPLLAEGPQWSFGALGAGASAKAGEDLFESDSVRNGGSNFSNDERDRMDDFANEEEHATRPMYGTPQEDAIPVLEGIPTLAAYGGEEVEAPVKEVLLDDEDEGSK